MSKTPSHQLHKNDQTQIARTLPSIPLPHSGQSYNPTLDSHSELLSSAYELALKREKKEAEGRQLKKDWEEGRETALKENLVEEEITDDEEDGDGETEKEKRIRRRIMGMDVDEPEDEEDHEEDEEEGEGEEGESKGKKVQKR